MMVRGIERIEKTKDNGTTEAAIVGFTGSLLGS